MAAFALSWGCAHGPRATTPAGEESASGRAETADTAGLPPGPAVPEDSVGEISGTGGEAVAAAADTLSPPPEAAASSRPPAPAATAGLDSLSAAETVGPDGERLPGASATADPEGKDEAAALVPPDWSAGRPLPGAGDELFGRVVARGSYEIRSLAGNVLVGHEDWELFEDDAGFRTLSSTAEMESDGASSSRTATVTVGPDLAFLEADLGSSAANTEGYATFRRSGDLLAVEAHGGAEGETRQQVRLPEGGIFVSQVFATRGWELAPFERPGTEARPAYLAGSAPGVLVGEVGSLAARPQGLEELRLGAGDFRTLLFEIPPADAPTVPPPSDGGDAAGILDRWWILAGSRIPAAAELPSLGVRVELVELEQEPEPAGRAAAGRVLARGVYHHRLARRTEPIAVESWTLAGDPEGGYLLECEIAYADGPRVSVRAVADPGFRVEQLSIRRFSRRGAEASAIVIEGGELRGEARGAGVGLAEQRVRLDGPVVFRASAAALEGWALVESAAAGGGSAAGPAGEEAPVAPADTLASAAKTLTYWLPAGAHPLGTLLSLPADIDLGLERVPTPARTFGTRRWASPAETPPLFRAVRWIFGPYRLPARVLFPGLGREAILVRYETPE